MKKFLLLTVLIISFMFSLFGCSSKSEKTRVIKTNVDNEFVKVTLSIPEEYEIKFPYEDETPGNLMKISTQRLINNEKQLTPIEIYKGEELVYQVMFRRVADALSEDPNNISFVSSFAYYRSRGDFVEEYKEDDGSTVIVSNKGSFDNKYYDTISIYKLTAGENQITYEASSAVLSIDEMKELDKKLKITFDHKGDYGNFS